MKKAHLDTANEVADMLAKAVAESPEKRAYEEEKKRKEKAESDARVQAALDAAKKSERALAIFRSTFAEEVQMNWYRDSFLAKLIPGAMLDIVNTRVLAWCNQTTSHMQVPDTPAEMFNLHIYITEAVMESDKDLIRLLAQACTTKVSTREGLSRALEEEVCNAVGLKYVLFNYEAWGTLVGVNAFAEKFKPVVNHAHLLLGVIGTINDAYLYTDAFRLPEARGFDPKNTTPEFILLKEELSLNSPPEFSNGRVVTTFKGQPLHAMTTKIDLTLGRNLIGYTRLIPEA